MKERAISTANARIRPAARRAYTARHGFWPAIAAAATSPTTDASRTLGPMNARDRNASAACDASIPGAMINDQYRNPVSDTSTAISSVAVSAASLRGPRCGQATMAISGSAEPESCRMMCHLNHGSGIDRRTSSLAHPTCPISHSAAHAAMAPKKTACRPRHAARRRMMTASGTKGGNSSAALPTSIRADVRSPSAHTSAAYRPQYARPAIAQFIRDVVGRDGQEGRMGGTSPGLPPIPPVLPFPRVRDQQCQSARAGAVR